MTCGPAGTESRTGRAGARPAQGPRSLAAHRRRPAHPAHHRDRGQRRKFRVRLLGQLAGPGDERAVRQELEEEGLTPSDMRPTPIEGFSAAGTAPVEGDLYGSPFLPTAGLIASGDGRLIHYGIAEGTVTRSLPLDEMPRPATSPSHRTAVYWWQTLRDRRGTSIPTGTWKSCTGEKGQPSSFSRCKRSRTARRCSS